MKNTHLLRVLLLASLAALAMALVPVAADAHRLRVTTAQKARNQAATAFARAVDGNRVTRSDGVGGTLAVEAALVGTCRRLSVHRMRCLIGARGDVNFDDGATDRFICAANFIVYYRRHSSRRVTTRIRDAECSRDDS